jgi:hypothetical protein
MTKLALTFWDIGEASGPILAGALSFAVGSLESDAAYLLAFSLVAVVMVAVGLIFGLTVHDPEVTIQEAW